MATACSTPLTPGALGTPIRVEPASEFASSHCKESVKPDKNWPENFKWGVNPTFDPFQPSIDDDAEGSSPGSVSRACGMR